MNKTHHLRVSSLPAGACCLARLLRSRLSHSSLRTWSAWSGRTMASILNQLATMRWTFPPGLPCKCLRVPSPPAVFLSAWTSRERRSTASREDRTPSTRLCAAHALRGRRGSNRARSGSPAQPLAQCMLLLGSCRESPATWSLRWRQWLWESRCRWARCASPRTTCDKVANRPASSSDSRRWRSGDSFAAFPCEKWFQAVPRSAIERRWWFV